MKNLLLILFFLPVFASGQIQIQTSFENPMPTNYIGKCVAAYSPLKCIEGSATWSHSISNVWSRIGTYSNRLELRQTDPEVGWGSWRVEHSPMDKGNINSYKPNCMRISFMVPSTGAAWINGTKELVLPLQWHPWASGNDGGSPSLSVNIVQGRIKVFIRHTNDAAVPTASNAKQTIVPYDLGLFPFDKTIDFEIFYSPKKDNTGRVIVDMIVDGVRKNWVNYTGPCLHAWSEYPFPKIGLYDYNLKSSPIISTTRVAYIDAVAYGIATESTFRSVIGLAGPGPLPPNQAPIISGFTTTDSYIAGTTGAALNVLGTDPEGGRVSYQWAKVSGSGTQTISNGTTKNATVAGLANGQSYVFRITVTDSVGATATATKSIIVATSNNAPVSIAGISRQLSLGADSVWMDGEATDVEDFDCCAIHVWSRVSGPNMPTFNPLDWNPKVTNMIAGTYVFKLTITDSGGLTSESTVSYTIPASTNQSPQVVPSPPLVVVRTGTTGSIGCINSDPDGPKPTVSWVQTSGPNASSITNPTSDTTGLTGLVVGTYNYTVTVTDNKGATARAVVVVVVNRPPVVTIDTTLSEYFSTSIVSVSANGSVNDPDGTIDSVRWTQIEGPDSAVFTPSNAVSTTISNLRPGRYIMRLTGTDNDQATGYQDYEFTIESGFRYRQGRLSNTVLKH